MNLRNTENIYKMYFFFLFRHNITERNDIMFLPSNLFFDSFLDYSDKEYHGIKCDVYEEDHLYHIVMDLPGITREDISINYSDGYLKIAVKKEEVKSENKKYLSQERKAYFSAKRSFYIGNVNEEEIKAEFKNGTLEIVVPIDNTSKDVKTINID